MIPLEMQALTPQARGFLSAGLRHLRDAEHLASCSAGRSLDQAYHLLGYAPECVRKACLSERSFDKAIGHSAGIALEVAIDLDPWACRYAGTDRSGPALAEWSESSRYERTGTRDAAEVSAGLIEAGEYVIRVAAELWADGRIEGEFL